MAPTSGDHRNELPRIHHDVSDCAPDDEMDERAPLCRYTVVAGIPESVHCGGNHSSHHSRRDDCDDDSGTRPNLTHTKHESAGDDHPERCA
ncbi:hypothetical protein HFX_1411 [Haloferax mediterranei ATCC 33500]|uniref:Uncharacterized protein n=1 Tax=Haloferax mediterranei (strain ATCC 33500 / DSM 1411 / JCM 8866 / NBRC 14739 / NCIMB 2177 / R-4) TaxID=523841 RepID=I3R4G1_HALMT|nr:hypothetical protein HFX_1411 [Haloferax mediterranei ATCC 33500]